MAIIKCKMCGGDLRIEEGATVCECEYCGTRQTVPSADNEKKLTLFSRAGRLLRSCEFDKAAGVFEAIVADFPEEAEAYWGLVLCKYGIEYVDDPATGKKVPTCHRSSFESVLDDPNFEQACENTDAVARRVYRDEARQIEDLRQAILQVSGKEEPYDVFISYKETDENGDRTLDSVIAQDIYKELTCEGYRVFFSRISLEDKLGTEYEPYIFAALNSAKVMLVVGTDYENFDSVWVKNEWSRFLKLIAAGQKKTLIPVFKNMDAYDMPKEFAKLAAQDMGKVGAMQDLLRGVEKIVGKKAASAHAQPAPQVVQQTVVQGGGPNVTALLKRGQQALEDGDWDQAKDFFNQVLNMDAENAEAFFGLFLTGAKCRDEREYIDCVCAYPGDRQSFSISLDKEREEKAVKAFALKDYLTEEALRKLFQYDPRYCTFTRENRQQHAEHQKKLLHDDKNYARAVRFAKGETAARLDRFKAELSAGLDAAVNRAAEQEAEATAAKKKEYETFLAEAEKKSEVLNRQAAEKKETDYQALCTRADYAGTEEACLTAAHEFETRFAGYKDSAERIEKCREKGARFHVLQEKAEAVENAARKKKRIIAGIIAAVAIVAVLIVTKVIIPSSQLKSNDEPPEEERRNEAISAETVAPPEYAEAEAFLEQGDYAHAAMAYGRAGNYEKSAALWELVSPRATIAASAFHTIAVKKDGTVISTRGNGYKDAGSEKNNTASWTDIVSVAAGNFHNVGLKADGTVVAVGDNADGACNTGEWTNIVSIVAGGHTVGLKSDGTVVAAGSNSNGQCEVSGWSDIVAIAAGARYTVALKADGTVLAVGDNKSGQCEVNDWKNIVAISATGAGPTVGLRADGTVVATEYIGDPEYNRGQCEVSDWKDIVAISTGGWHTVGLKANGTVVATAFTGREDRGYCNVNDWSDVVAIAAGNQHTIALNADGSVVAVGWNDVGQCDVSGWRDIKLPNT